MIEIIFIESDSRESITINLQYLTSFRVEKTRWGRSLFLEVHNQRTIEVQDNLMVNTTIDKLREDINNWF